MENIVSLTLYAVCSLGLAATAVFLVIRDKLSPLIRWFVATCLALLIWVVTLFLFNGSTEPGFLLKVGRVNFAAVSLAVYFGWRFVRSVASRPRRLHETIWLIVSVSLCLLSVFTPWIDQEELVGTAPGTRHETVYGPLFPLYALHILLLLGASVWTAFRSAGRRKGQGAIHDQLLLIGWGILTTGVVGIITNVLLPFAFRDFRFIDFGPLSTLLFLLAVAYAVVRHQLFDIRVFLRRTLVLGIALSLVLAAYSALVLLATDRFASSESGGVTRFGVLLLAFSFDPIRRLLEKRIDMLLFPAKRK